MALLSFARFFTALVSLVLLAVGGYLLWSWYDGRLVQDAAGLVWRQRDAWRLWAGLGLMAWSFLGGRLLPLLLTRRDERPTSAKRGAGRMIDSPTGSRLYVEEHGPAAAPTVILTHGWGMDSTFWRYAVADLGDRIRLVTWDLPGLGKSRAAPHRVDLSAYAADLAALIEASGARRPVLAGHSIGGMIIQTLIKERPDLEDRIAGVVLLNTTYTNPLKTMMFSRLLLALQKPVIEPMMHLTRWLNPLVWLMQWQSYLSGSSHLALRLGFGRYVTRSQLEHVTLLSTRNSPAVQAQGNLAMLHWDATGAFARLRKAALVIGGDLDIVTKLEANRAIAAENPKATLHVVEGVNHLGPMERAELYNRQIAEFVLSVEPALSADVRTDAARAPSRAPAASPEPAGRRRDQLGRPPRL